MDAPVVAAHSSLVGLTAAAHSFALDVAHSSAWVMSAALARGPPPAPSGVTAHLCSLNGSAVMDHSFVLDAPAIAIHLSFSPSSEPSHWFPSIPPVVPTYSYPPGPLAPSWQEDPFQGPQSQDGHPQLAFDSRRGVSCSHQSFAVPRRFHFAAVTSHATCGSDAIHLAVSGFRGPIRVTAPRFTLTLGCLMVGWALGTHCGWQRSSTASQENRAWGVLAVWTC